MNGDGGPRATDEGPGRRHELPPGEKLGGKVLKHDE